MSKCESLGFTRNNALLYRIHINASYTAQMHTYVNICFEIPDQSECDVMFKYLTEHPKDIWNYEDRVEHKFTQLFDKPFMDDARWTDDDILDTHVTRLKHTPSGKDSNVIQYEVTIRRGASDAKILVDILRRCKCVQEGVVGGNWKIHVWYRGWTVDRDNNGQPYYQTYTGFNRNVIDPDLIRDSRTIQTLLEKMRELISKYSKSQTSAVASGSLK